MKKRLPFLGGYSQFCSFSIHWGIYLEYLEEEVPWNGQWSWAGELEDLKNLA